MDEILMNLRKKSHSKKVQDLKYKNSVAVNLIPVLKHVFCPFLCVESIQLLLDFFYHLIFCKISLTHAES